MNSRKIFSRGFTLIELVIVIVILGILAASAAPKFIDLPKFDTYIVKNLQLQRFERF